MIRLISLGGPDSLMKMRQPNGSPDFQRGWNHQVAGISRVAPGLFATLRVTVGTAEPLPRDVVMLSAAKHL